MKLGTVQWVSEVEEQMGNGDEGGRGGGGGGGEGFVKLER